jgi:hypothetical protein
VGSADEFGLTKHQLESFFPTLNTLISAFSPSLSDEII